MNELPHLQQLPTTCGRKYPTTKKKQLHEELSSSKHSETKQHAIFVTPSYPAVYSIIKLAKLNDIHCNGINIWLQSQTDQW